MAPATAPPNAACALLALAACTLLCAAVQGGSGGRAAPRGKRTWERWRSVARTRGRQQQAAALGRIDPWRQPGRVDLARRPRSTRRRGVGAPPLRGRGGGRQVETRYPRRRRGRPPRGLSPGAARIDGSPAARGASPGPPRIGVGLMAQAD
ncbi:hypothetical protein PVAP13_1KG213415 [Panicum virgatum]|uniref:Uncharacterized protein n=1 Tax=Panicum virgatum TaxID=38727 RepID=A0A8T0XH84_PANVG|nr:hypothetical protein PVAP13_1KG213415 [Panicum virgatum]